MAELVERFEVGPIREAMSGALERRLSVLLDLDHSTGFFCRAPLADRLREVRVQAPRALGDAVPIQ